MTGKDGRIIIVETLIGIFGVTEDKKIIEEALYPRDPKKIAAILERHSEGEPSKELMETLEKLHQRGFVTFLTSNQALAESMRKAGFKTERVEAFGTIDFIKEKLEEMAVGREIVENESEFYALNRDVSILRAKSEVRRAQARRGAVIAQTVQLLEELDKSLNALSGKLKEWYGLHFPELDRIVGDHRTYAEMISKFGNREGITAKELSAMKLRGKSNKIVSASENSMGALLLPEDEEQMKRLAENLLSLYSYRAELERHIIRVAEEVAPNLSKVAGPVLAAKLIEKSSGLRKLAMMPSSTVQVLGAEKALFRAKKTNAKPPKHGVIFQHPYIHTKPRRERGRAARNLASKLSLAARADAFSGNAIGIELRRELEEGC